MASQATQEVKVELRVRPLISLSVKLITTYKNINLKYYEKKKKAQAPTAKRPEWDDESYNYKWTPQELIGAYQVEGSSLVLLHVVGL